MDIYFNEKNARYQKENNTSVRIWDSQADVPELSNVAKIPINFIFTNGDEMTFSTAEHAWQILKFINPDGSISEKRVPIVTELSAIADPIEVKNSAREVSDKYIPQYRKNKNGGFISSLPLRRMILIIRAKLNSLKREGYDISRFKGMVIFEAPPDNSVNPRPWGVSIVQDASRKVARGENYLGRIIMRRINFEF